MRPLFPFRAFVRPLQELNGVYSNCNFPFPHVFPQPPFPLNREPTASAPRGDNTQHSHRLLSFSFYVTRSRTKRIQTRPLTCTIHQARRSLFSPPCGSCSVFEVAHTVYKYALNKCSFIHLRALHAKHQASTRTELRFEFLSLSF